MVDNHEETLSFRSTGQVVNKASDDIAGVFYDIIKLAFGALDSATIVSAAAGLPVDIVANTAGVGGGTQYDEDTAHVSGDKVTMAGVVQQSADAALSTDGDRSLLQVDGTGFLKAVIKAALPTGTNAIGKLAANSGVDIGDVDVLSIAAGSNLIGDVGLQPRTSGGLSFFKTIDLDETEEAVKTSAGQIYGLHVMNLTAALLYFKIYNASVATVVVGTTVPDITIPIPGNNDTDGAGFVWNIPHGIAFGTAITIACTTGIADADAGAPAANVCVATVLYK